MAKNFFSYYTLTVHTEKFIVLKELIIDCMENHLLFKANDLLVKANDYMV